MNVRPLSCRLLALSFLLAASIGAAAPAKLEVCVACHGEDGEGVGFDYVPIIAGTPAAHLEEALYAYQDGARKCVGVPVMCEAISTLSDAEIVGLADYFSSLPRISSDEPFDSRLARDGELIHAEHCAMCHVSPDDANAEDALGIPLNGQRTAYLRLALGAYMTGDRDTLVPSMAEKIALLDPGKIEALVNYYASYKQ